MKLRIGLLDVACYGFSYALYDLEKGFGIGWLGLIKSQVWNFKLIKKYVHVGYL